MNKPDQHHLSDCCQSSPTASIDAVCGMTVEASSPHRAEHAGTIYTCPMHPEVRQIGPDIVPSVAWRWNP